ncbi:hypothetical protein OGAPHI_004564 [Ogataea philodendri]|uniref:mRNA export factor GLE1 n=1 Tax=Ogataea philodendri TaxID=1378263 RepID=A0A9P8P292_9ASCO|nr:uncharacterized protein OGAPHI_004564 [Ogataea philodendri]KAH3664213.1 hypothetical protein OGAPHI_004564 [Ogataea philodendri]
MRFTPHRDERLQYEFGDVGSDYDSLTESEDDLEDLGQILASVNLKNRFEYVSKVYEEEEKQPVVVRIGRVDDGEEAGPIDAELVEDEKFDFSEYYSQRVSKRLEQSRKRVLELEAAENERIRQIKEQKRLEELRKRQEEERRRKEEEERRLAEEKRKQLEEQKRIELEQQKRLDEEKKKKEEEERKRAALEAAKKAEKGKTNFLAVEQLFFKYKQDIVDIKANVVEKLKDPANNGLKKIVGAQKRKINPKFGQLTNSEPQWQRIVSQIYELVTEAKTNELAYKWLLNFMAKAIVSQAETEVTVKPDSSVPLAKLALNLMVVFPEFSYYLLARFVKKCPLVIGYTCKIDTEEGRLRMGWKRKGDGKWEEDIQYDERLSGIATVYAVMCRYTIDTTFFRCDVGQTQHPLPISNAWRLQSRLLNTPMELVTNVHFAVAGAWWEACAHEMCQAYGKQGQKLLQVTCMDWTASVAERKYSGAARLRLMGDDWHSSGGLKKFKRMMAQDVPNQ